MAFFFFFGKLYLFDVIVEIFTLFWVSFLGKRRALIPPSAGYVNENLKPIPEEVRYALYY